MGDSRGYDLEGSLQMPLTLVQVSDVPEVSLSVCDDGLTCVQEFCTRDLELFLALPHNFGKQLIASLCLSVHPSVCLLPVNELLRNLVLACFSEVCQEN